tara:strand:+ start:827 stop:1027 length:201 start_codon:yes stop_codon:yes gene_type:complete
MKIEKLKPYQVTATMTYTMEVDAEDYSEAVGMGRERLIDIPFEDWSLAEVKVEADELLPRINENNV